MEEARRFLYALIKKYHIDEHDEGAARLIALLEIGRLTEFAARCALPSIQKIADEQEKFPSFLLAAPPTNEELNPNGPPDVSFGDLVERPEVPVGANVNGRSKGILIIGAAGAGKSTTIRCVAEGYAEAGRRDPSRRVNLFGIDVKDDLAQFAEKHRDSTIYPDTQSLYTGIDGPLAVQPDQWINTVATIIAARAGLVAAWTCLANMIRWAAPILSTPGTDRLRYPSLRLLLQIATRAPLQLWAAKPDYAKSLIQALEGIVNSTKMFDCFWGLDINSLIASDKHLIIRAVGMSPAWVRQIFEDLLLTRALQGRMARRQKVARTNCVVYLDEMDRDATRESDQEFSDGMSPMAEFFRFSSEYGFKPVIALSKLTDASPHILNEPATTISFNQSAADSVSLAARTLLLRRGAERLLPALPAGMALVRLAQRGSCSEAMLVKMRDCPADFAPITRGFDTVPYEPHRDLDDLPELKLRLEELVAQRFPRPGKASTTFKKTKSKYAISATAKAFLELAAKRPFVPCIRLWEQLGAIPFSVREGCTKELVDNNFAEFVEPRIGRAKRQLVGVLDAGYQYLDMTPIDRRGNVTLEHRTYAQWVGMWCHGRGFRDVRLEAVIPDTPHRADVVALTDQGLECWEIIVACSDNLVSHLRACLERPTGIIKVHVVTEQKQIRDRIEAMVRAELPLSDLLSRVQFDVIESYLLENCS
jgi:hypothetical protein